MTEVLPLPTFSDINPSCGLPDASHASDHLPIMATLQLLPDPAASAVAPSSGGAGGSAL